LRIHFPLLNHTELHHYRVTCIILWPSIEFYSSPNSSSSSSSSSSSTLSLAIVIYSCSARLL
jgi:hypothetical protein